MGTHLNPCGLGVDDCSHPLLNKSLDHQCDDHEIGISPAPSEEYSAIAYNYGHRPFRDICFPVMFVMLVLTTYAGGVYSIMHHNRDYKHAASFVYQHNSSSCAKSSILVTRNSASLVTGENVTDGKLGFQLVVNLISGQFLFQHSHGHVVKELVWTLAITLILSIPFLFGLLWLLNTFTKHIVYTCLPVLIFIPILTNVVWFVACEANKHCKESFSLVLRISAFLFLFVLCGIIVWIVYANRDRIDLTIRVLHTASEALRRNMSLLLVLPGLILLFLIYLVPIVLFLFFARSNGEVIPNPKVEEYEYPCGGISGVDCCLWKEDRWVQAYYAVAIFTMIWSATAMIEAQVYIVSGTVAQWYFEKAGSSPSGSIKSSMSCKVVSELKQARCERKAFDDNNCLASKGGDARDQLYS
eukprot:Gb_08976 [translate_table: standard]